MKRILLSLLLAGITVSLFSQTPTQTLRGRVINAYTSRPVEDVTVSVSDLIPARSVITDAEGAFRFDSLPVGRHDLIFSHPDFQPFKRAGVLLTASREEVLELEMEARLFQMEEVTLSPISDRGKARNEMATVSALSIDPEMTRKFAGGLDDPVRLAANLPGVNGNGFISDNLISIRGNSPRGFMYRVEGAEIPNPNHFARIGTSGGTFTIFSNQLLDRSDFFTGAFPAEYGNATAGVFDVRFRNGNNERHNFALQLGVLGVDLAAEGPFSKNSKASYLVNYRFSTLTVANLLINYLTLPEFQDLSFKLNFPTKKAGTFAIFGISGTSIRIKEAETDPANWTQDLDRFQNVLSSDMAAVGVTHSLLLGKKSLWKSSLVGSYSQQKDNKDYLEENLQFQLRDRNEYKRQPISFSTSLKHSFSNRHVNKTGIILTTTHHDHLALNYDYVQEQTDTLVDESGRDIRVQAYTQSLFRLSPKFTLNLGVHFLYYNLNGQYSIEPRAGLQYEVAAGHTLGLGYGRHSQVEDFATYATRMTDAAGIISEPNRNLDFVKAHHLVLSYFGRLTEHIRFRSELYYQYLYDVPVEAGGSFSVLNLEELVQLRILNNGGTGRNVGLDLGFEHYTFRGFYYLINASIFDSKYVGGDGVERNTAFDTGYKVNLLAGQEFKIGQKREKNKLMGLNFTLSALGGNRYTPIDLEASRAARETVYDESLAWSEQNQNLYVLDFTWTLRNVGNRFSHFWAIQIKNLLQSAAPAYREYDATLDEVVELTGASILPVLSYKLEF